MKCKTSKEEIYNLSVNITFDSIKEAKVFYALLNGGLDQEGDDWPRKVAGYLHKNGIDPLFIISSMNKIDPSLYGVCVRDIKNDN